MLYLPELGLYTDPTASSAAFGVLPTLSYDKPVLHISEAGGRPARTPPMNSEDHVTTSRTTVTVAADGSISGETRQISTGVFAAGARQVASRIETQGREKYAENQLRALGRPGTGIFEAARPSDFSEPFSLHGSFLLNDKLQMPLIGVRDMPIGLPIHKRPGFWSFGQRIANRKTDFACFAVKQVEEIEVTFAEGLPMPKALKGDAIDTKYFSYRSSYDVDGRVLRMRREFASKVASQVCLQDTEVEISDALKRVARSLGTRMVFGDAPPAAL
jgi:hypothetical protein